MSNQSASRLLDLREAGENYPNHIDLEPLSTQPKITKIIKKISKKDIVPRTCAESGIQNSLGP